MLTKTVSEELNKIKPKMEKVDDYNYVIKKQLPINESLQLEHFYVIKLADYILHPGENFTLASNWNKGNVPKSTYMVGKLLKIAGKMLQFDCVGYDIEHDVYLNERYSDLWLPLGGVDIIREAEF